VTICGSLRNSVVKFKSANQPPPQSSPEVGGRWLPRPLGEGWGEGLDPTKPQRTRSLVAEDTDLVGEGIGWF
jgi:hypothetical protein